MTKAERAINALRDAADAYDDLPPGIRTGSLLGGPVIITSRLRQEADAIEARMVAYKEASQ